MASTNQPVITTSIVKRSTRNTKSLSDLQENMQTLTTGVIPGVTIDPVNITASIAADVTDERLTSIAKNVAHYSRSSATMFNFMKGDLWGIVKQRGHGAGHQLMVGIYGEELADKQSCQWANCYWIAKKYPAAYRDLSKSWSYYRNGGKETGTRFRIVHTLPPDRIAGNREPDAVYTYNPGAGIQQIKHLIYIDLSVIEIILDDGSVVYGATDPNNKVQPRLFDSSTNQPIVLRPDMLPPRR